MSGMIEFLQPAKVSGTPNSFARKKPIHTFSPRTLGDTLPPSQEGKYDRSFATINGVLEATPRNIEQIDAITTLVAATLPAAPEELLSSEHYKHPRSETGRTRRTA